MYYSVHFVARRTKKNVVDRHSRNCRQTNERAEDRKRSTKKFALARRTEEQQRSEIAGSPRKHITTKQSSTLGGHRPLRMTSSACLVRVLGLKSSICRDNRALFGKREHLTVPQMSPVLGAQCISINVIPIFTHSADVLLCPRSDV